jgi:hypothetical protein
VLRTGASRFGEVKAMTRSLRRVVHPGVEAVLAVVIWGVVQTLVAASADEPRVPRVRSDRPAIRAFIDEATVRSATFLTAEPGSGTETRSNTTGGQQLSSGHLAPESPRVRGADPALAALIQDATNRSETFRRLVDAIQATDGIVHVVGGRCGHYVRTCLMFWIQVAGPHRILRVMVDERKTGIDAAASIAHELQHALEVLQVPGIKTAGEMHGLFERIGTWRRYSFETVAAVKVGDAVRSELSKSSPARVK